jgi:hypothetical protein
MTLRQFQTGERPSPHRVQACTWASHGGRKQVRRIGGCPSLRFNSYFTSRRADAWKCAAPRRGGLGNQTTFNL